MRYGAGTAILIGTFPSEGYFRTSSELIRIMIRQLLEHLNINASLKVNNEFVHARLCENNGNRFLWLINHSDRFQNAEVIINGCSGVGDIYWGCNENVTIEHDKLCVCIPGKDALVLKIT
jgi:beta-galactosidase